MTGAGPGQPGAHFPSGILQDNHSGPGWSFLLQEAELRLVKFLPEILALQRSLVEQFQNVSEVEYQSIRGFIGSQNSGMTPV